MSVSNHLYITLKPTLVKDLSGLDLKPFASKAFSRLSHLVSSGANVDKSPGTLVESGLQHFFYK